MSYRDGNDFAKQTGETLRTIRGMIRRLAVKLTDGVLWQLVGQRGGQGGDEVVHLEVFPGIGIYARPPASGAPEAIAAAIAGAPKARVVIATRDEATRQAVVAALPDGEIGEGETIVYTPSVVIHLRANNTVEIRTLAGTAKRLLTEDDAQALKGAIENAGTTGGDGGAAFKVALLENLEDWPAGTTVLKAE